MWKVKVPALVCEQNSKSFFIAVIQSKLLKEVCFISRRDEDSKEWFQRNLNEARAKSISKYLDDQKGIIPSALILSAQQNAGLKFIKWLIEFEDNKKSFMVIDWQHRMFWLIQSKNNYEIPVVIFNWLRTEEEVNLFIDINTNQKGVPTSLLLDIKQLTWRETDKEQLKRELFDEINKNSVLAWLMSPSKSVVWKISRVTFNSALESVINNPFFKEKETATIVKGVKNYLAACERVFIRSKSSKAKLTNSIFFNALFRIFNTVVDKSLDKYWDLKTESLELVIDPISKLAYDNYTWTSSALLTRVTNDMMSELNEYEKYRDLENDGMF